MGDIDSEGKQYFSINSIFADLFNYLLYDGKPVIQPDKLKELDTTEIAIPYGNGARVPVQKYRDLLKLWSAMMDDNAIYVMLGAEIQDKIHYAMPVRRGLYDMIGYSRQVEEAGKSYRTKSENKEGNLYAEDGTIKIKLSSEEFLSGFRKEDKLIPIITATVYLSADKWDGPLDLHDMIDVKDKGLLKFIPNYPINLIAPANMVDTDFAKFSTDLGFAMNVLKHQNDAADKILEETNHKRIDRNTAVFLNTVAKLGLEIEDKEEEIDMCVAMENRMKKEKVMGAIEVLRVDGKSDEDIIAKVMKLFDVSREYVQNLLAPKAV